MNTGGKYSKDPHTNICSQTYCIIPLEGRVYHEMAGHTANTWKHKLKQNQKVSLHTSQAIYLKRTLEIINSTLLEKKGGEGVLQAAAKKLYVLPIVKKLITSKTKTTNPDLKTGDLFTLHFFTLILIIKLTAIYL